MVKAEYEDGSVLGKFDLGYIPAKLHMVFLYFLRMNHNMRSLHARNINLKSDVIKYLMKDFTNLREFTLSFGQPQKCVVGGGWSNVHSKLHLSTKRREISSLFQAILSHWQSVEYVQLEKF
jgi:hypothetical protein